MVAGGAGVHSRIAHWAGISHFCVVSMSHGLLSFSIIILVVFCLQFPVTINMMSLLSTMLCLFDPIFHTYSEIFSTANNNLFSFTLQR